MVRYQIPENFRSLMALEWHVMSLTSQVLTGPICRECIQYVYVYIYISCLGEVGCYDHDLTPRQSKPQITVKKSHNILYHVYIYTYKFYTSKWYLHTTCFRYILAYLDSNAWIKLIGGKDAITVDDKNIRHRAKVDIPGTYLELLRQPCYL